MVFSSPVFLFLFLPLVLAAHYFAPRRLRNTVLLAASLFFYAWGEKSYVVVMLLSIAMNYVFGRGIEAWRERRAGATFLATAIIANLIILIFFKYINFCIANVSWVLATPIHHKPVHLPIGISFFTFEAIAYLMDIRRGETNAQRNPIDFGLFMTLFPHLIAGPVVRYRDLAAAIAGRNVSLTMTASGTRRFIIGLAKKLLLANVLARTADTLFGLPPDQLAFSAAWLGLICYTLQIYFDFSGYSDMAIGLGRMLGFELCENFRYPYTAASVTDFWRRWHISLSTWFRDYLYIPLGGNRRGNGRTYVNLLIVFVLCGLWHGASWTFLAWGVIHGFFLVLERMGLGRRILALPVPLRHGYAMLAVMIGWVVFRADTFGQAVGYFSALAGLSHGMHTLGDYLNRELILAMAVGLIACLPVLPMLEKQWERIRERLGTTGEAVGELAQIAVLAGLFVASGVVLAAGTYNPFIYYRF